MHSDTQPRSFIRGDGERKTGNLNLHSDVCPVASCPALAVVASAAVNMALYRVFKSQKTLNCSSRHYDLSNIGRHDAMLKRLLQRSRWSNSNNSPSIWIHNIFRSRANRKASQN